MLPHGGGLNEIVGLCVPGDQNVPASNLATAVCHAPPILVHTLAPLGFLVWETDFL